MTALLHCASSFSFLTGTLPLRRLCERAVEAGILHLGLCDWGGLYGIPQFAHEADRVGLHALHGVELGLDANRLFALARDEAGFRSLCRLVSGYRMSELEEREEEEADAGLLLSLLRRHQEGLWLFCDQAPFVERLAAVVDREGLRVALPPLLGFQRLRRDHGGNEEPRGARSRAAPLREELEPATRKVPDPPPPPERERLQQLAAGLGLGCVAAPWVVYGGPGERALHRLAVAVKKGRLVERVAEEELAWPGSFLPTQDELREGYADRPELLSEAERIAESCTLSLTEPRPLVFPSAMGLTGLSGEAAEERAAEALSARVGAGLIRLYGRPDGGRPGSARLAEARARLEHELRAIGELGFCGYFLIVDEIVSLARAHGIPCIGRGSAADSLVAYCLGFTDADPLHYKLCFERFLNSERFRCGEGDQLPDIDLDFCWRRRDEMLELVTRRFGEGHVALLCTQPALGFRAAYREAARAMGLPVDEVDRRSRGLPRRISGELLARGREGDFSVLAGVLRRTPEFRRRLSRLAGGPEERNREARIWRGAFGLSGMQRCLGLHPGGTVLSHRPLQDFAPLERAAKGLPSIQWDKHVAPHMGLVKIDLLGNRGLSIHEDAKRELLRLGVSVEEADQTPDEDEMTGRLLCRGQTIGCIQIESPGMRALLTRMEARRLDDVIKAIALIRPGPASSGMMDHYIKRKRGEKRVPELPPEIGSILEGSLGVMLYQEDVILILAALCDIDGGQADLLRRRIPEDEGARGQFFDAARRRGLPDGMARALWEQIARFSAFSFNKAHAVTYGRLAWRIARMKARQPAAVLAAMLANDTGYYEKRVYVDEAKRIGVPVLAPCVNRSGIRFQTERQGAAGAPALRTGLVEIRDLPLDFLETLLHEREERGPFFSVEDFLVRLEERGHGVEEAWVERLILAGGFDLLEGTRPEKLWRFRVDFKRRRRRKGAAPLADELFSGSLLQRAPVIPCLPEFDDKERARLELGLLGFTTGMLHPIELGEPERDGKRAYLPLVEAPAHVGERVSILGWLAAQRRYRTRRGDWMCFLTFEDKTGILETVLFPPAYDRFGGELSGQGRYHVRGRIEAREGALALHAESLERMGD